jgi:hypothetical protein
MQAFLMPPFSKFLFYTLFYTFEIISTFAAAARAFLIEATA